MPKRNGTAAQLTGRPRRRATAAVRARRRPCPLCGYPIDQRLDRIAHPLGSAVDEWFPRKLGGDPLDPTNTVEMHRLCNGMKSATWPVTDELRQRCRDRIDQIHAGASGQLAVERTW